MKGSHGIFNELWKRHDHHSTCLVLTTIQNLEDLKKQRHIVLIIASKLNFHASHIENLNWFQKHIVSIVTRIVIKR